MPLSMKGKEEGKFYLFWGLKKVPSCYFCCMVKKRREAMALHPFWNCPCKVLYANNAILCLCHTNICFKDAILCS